MIPATVRNRPASDATLFKFGRHSACSSENQLSESEERYNHAIHWVLCQRMNLRCFCAFPLIILTSPLFGATDETAWKLLMTEAGRAQDHRQFDSAEIAYSSAMHVAGQITNDPVYQGITANSLALLYH